jgi:hypothetical protein
MATLLPECSICYDPVIDHPAPEGSEATGSHRSSCGHLFHPKCIAKWHLRQEESTCPNCRKKAAELEDCAPEEEEEEGDEEEGDEEEGDEEEEEEEEDLVYLSRANMEYVLRNYGGTGVTYEVDVDVDYDLIGYGEAPIPRWLLERFLQEQGARKLSDSQWSQLVSVYSGGV